jgi:hypothetical protein
MHLDGGSVLWAQFRPKPKVPHELTRRVFQVLARFQIRIGHPSIVSITLFSAAQIVLVFQFLALHLHKNAIKSELLRSPVELTEAYFARESLPGTRS